jgi:RNA polymerase sigma-70 factor, ECF subfamily
VTSLPGRAGAVDVMTSRDGGAAEFEKELGPVLGEAVRLATGMLLNATEAEDAVQEACVRAWRHRANRRAGTDLRPWFLGIVANQCRETLRSRWARVLRLSNIATSNPVASRDPASILDLRRALSRLAYRRRLVLLLRYYLDLSFEEVAAAAGCSVDAAKALERRGTADLERALSMSEAND